jgi:hypothetical protein
MEWKSNAKDASKSAASLKSRGKKLPEHGPIGVPEKLDAGAGSSSLKKRLGGKKVDK